MCQKFSCRHSHVKTVCLVAEKCNENCANVDFAHCITQQVDRLTYLTVALQIYTTRSLHSLDLLDPKVEVLLRPWLTEKVVLTHRHTDPSTDSPEQPLDFLISLSSSLLNKSQLLAQFNLHLLDKCVLVFILNLG